MRRMAFPGMMVILLGLTMACGRMMGERAGAQDPPSAAPCAEWLATARSSFPIGIWYDGRVNGVNVPEGCTDVPAGQEAARAFYLKTFTDIHAHNIDIVVIPNTPPEYREALLSAADQAKVKVVLEVAELAWPEFGGELSLRNPNMIADEAQLRQRLTPIVDPLRHHPSLFAWQLLDEPPAELVPGVQRAARVLGALDPKHPGFSCLCNEGELDRSAGMGTPMVIFDRYPLGVTVQPGQYDFKQWTKLLEQIHGAAAAKGLPYWMAIQTCGIPGKLRMPMAAELNAMTWLAISRNCKGVFYFIYNSNTQTEHLEGLVAADLTPHPLYAEVSRLSSQLKALAPLLLKLQPAESIVTGTAEGKVDARTFRDGRGRNYLVLVNTDVTAPATFTGTIKNPAARKVADALTGEKTDMQKSDSGATFNLTLGAGEGRLLRVE